MINMERCFGLENAGRKQKEKICFLCEKKIIIEWQKTYR